MEITPRSVSPDFREIEAPVQSVYDSAMRAPLGFDPPRTTFAVSDVVLRVSSLCRRRRV